ALLPQRATKVTTTLNIYTRDMLPNSHTGSERAPLPDTQWAGYDKEKINVMMPVNLYECFVVLLSAPRLRKIKFWRVLADVNSRNWHIIDVHQLQSLIIRDTETPIANLLDMLKIENLRNLKVYYSADCGRKFAADKPAYNYLFETAENVIDRGKVVIRPNHPAYSERMSSLQVQLSASLDNHDWTVIVTDSEALSHKRC
ncbi:hypothetical protein BD626DRAFT_397067, partial [Schizophyllum amplum]